MAVSRLSMVNFAFHIFVITWSIMPCMSDMRCGRQGQCVCENSYDLTTDTDLIKATCPLDKKELSWPAFAGRIRSWIKLNLDVKQQRFSPKDVIQLQQTISDVQGYYGKIMIHGRYACQFVQALNSPDLVCQEDHVVSPIHINCLKVSA